MARMYFRVSEPSAWDRLNVRIRRDDLGKRGRLTKAVATSIAKKGTLAFLHRQDVLPLHDPRVWTQRKRANDPDSSKIDNRFRLTQLETSVSIGEIASKCRLTFPKVFELQDLVSIYFGLTAGSRPALFNSLEGLGSYWLFMSLPDFDRAVLENALNAKDFQRVYATINHQQKGDFLARLSWGSVTQMFRGMTGIEKVDFALSFPGYAARSALLGLLDQPGQEPKI